MKRKKTIFVGKEDAPIKIKESGGCLSNTDFKILPDGRLLPCPFCGGEAEIIDLDSNRFHVQCKVCPGLLGEVWGTSQSPELLTSLWNRRIENTNKDRPKKFKRMWKIWI